MTLKAGGGQSISNFIYHNANQLDLNLDLDLKIAEIAHHWN